MSAPHVTIGQQVDPANMNAPLGAPLDLHAEGLVGMHVCIVANARSGKSGLIRVLLEQTTSMQKIVLDSEDEFYTLGATGDFLVIGGKDGAAPATPANAAAIAMMVLESGINVVIQLNRIPISEQQEFIANFLDAIMAAPDELWHPALIVIDEAHRYAPQDSAPPSRQAIHELTSRGGKRGFTAVLATQRLAKIDKDVTGDCNNWFMGRNGQDTDRQSACKAMGFRPSSTEGKGLLTLPPRHFWAFGVATEPVPTLFRVSTSSTAIPKAGQQKLPMPPTSAALAPMLEALKKAAEVQPVKSVEVGGPAISEMLKEELQADKEWIHQPSYNAGAGQGSFDGYQEGLHIGTAQGMAIAAGRLRDLAQELQTDAYEGLTEEGREEIDRLAKAAVPEFVVPSLSADEIEQAQREHGSGGGGQIIPEEPPARPVRQPRAPSVASDTSEGITAAQQRVLDTLRWWDDMGHKQVTRQRACVMAGYSPKASTFGVYISQLTKMNLVYVPAPGMLMLTTGGFEKTKPQKGRRSLTDAARELLDGRAREVFDILVEVGPSGISRHILADRMLLSRSASTLGVYISKASALGFIDIPRPGEVALADWLIA